MAGTQNVYNIKATIKKYMNTGVRILTDNYEDHELLLNNLRLKGKYRIEYSGHNNWIVDKNEYSFYIAIRFAYDGPEKKKLRPLNDEDREFFEAFIADMGFLKLITSLTPEDTMDVPEWYGKGMPFHDSPEKSNIDSDEVKNLLDSHQKDLQKAISDSENRLFEALTEIKKDALDNLVKYKDLDKDSTIRQYQEDYERNLAKVQEEYARNLKEKDSYIEMWEDSYKKLEDEVKAQNREKEQMDGSPYSTPLVLLQNFIKITEGEPIEVHDKAIKSIAKCSCKRLLELFQLLLSIREFALHKYKWKLDIGNPIDWFSLRGYKYKAQDSKPTSNNPLLKQEREILYNGKMMTMENHITEFQNSKNGDCIHVYFFSDDEAQKLIIGYCGKHMKTVNRK